MEIIRQLLEQHAGTFLKNLCRQAPATSMVSKWVEQAKTIEPMVTH